MIGSMPRIVARGDARNERVIFTVKAAGLLSSLVLLDSEYFDDSSIAAGQRSAFWFGPDRVDAGDRVIVYTREGTESVRPRDDGRRNHFFYRGLKGSLYASKEACVVLAEIGEWQTSSKG